MNHGHEPGETCALCGAQITGPHRHVRFRLPDPVLALPDRERTPGSWLSHGDAVQSVMMQIPHVGAFVRVLLPVRLDDGGSVTYGTWMAVSPDDLQRAFALWWSPDYPSLRLEGYLGNEIAPGHTLGAPVEATVLNVDHTPYITGSSDVRVRDLVVRTCPASDHLPAAGQAEGMSS